MDILIELLLEIILEGCTELSFEKKIPLPLRVLCAVIAGTVYLAIVGLLVYLAIKNKSVLLLLAAGFVAAIVLLAFRKKYREMKTAGRNRP